MKSIRSSFCSFRGVKLQNEDLRQNALIDAKTLKSMGSSFCIIARKTGKTKSKEQLLRLTFVITSLTYEEFTA